MRDFLEWSVLRAWVRSWLQYCQWYYSTAMAPDVPIEAFFTAPVVNRNWKIDRTDPDLVRFGLMWKIYDMVAIRGLNFQLPIFGIGTWIPNGPWLLGGITGTDFLVSALGVDQPRAGRGVVNPGQVIDFGITPAVKTIRYKTKGVADRQCVLGYIRRSKSGKEEIL